MNKNMNKGKISVERSSLLYQTYIPTVIQKSQTYKWTITPEARDSPTAPNIVTGEVDQPETLVLRWPLRDITI